MEWHEIESKLGQGMELHGKGDLRGAADLYQTILEAEPDQPRANHLLGLALHQSGDTANGIRFMEKGFASGEASASELANYGSLLKAAGRFEEALSAFERGMALDADFLPLYYNAGEVYCSLGRYEEGERSLEQAAALNGRLPSVWYNLGLCRSEMGRSEAAVESYHQAIEIEPRYGQAYYGLGRAYVDLGRLEEASAALRSAIGLGCSEADCRMDLAGIALQLGRYEEVAQHLERLAALGAADEAAYNNLAIAYQSLGDEEAAERAVEQALSLKPDCVEALCTKSSLLIDAGRFEEAIDVARRALEREPRQDIAWNNLGTALRGVARLEEAVEAYREAARLNPDRAETQNNLGLALLRLRDYAGMEERFRRALELKPGYASCYSNYATGLIECGRISEAASLLQRALGYDDGLGAAWSNLGRARYELGDFEGARQAYLQALELGERADATRVALAATQVANAALSDETLYRYHREAAEALEREASVEAPDWPTQSVGKLRIGFVSGDFRRHSVAFFLMPLFEAIDRERFEIYCYSTVTRPDEMTARFEALSDGWRLALERPTDLIKGWTREDRISVLFDLSGYTQGNCLRLFARRAAPVQATWLGYPHSTGLSRIDYRLVDEKTDPEGVTLNSETPWRLPDSFLCYGLPGNAPDPAPPPSLEKGYVTFGSFNNIVKLNAASIELYASAMRSVDGSRLVLKSHQMADDTIRERVREGFRACGIDPDRVELLPRLKTLREHLDSYRRVDVALDTYPYNGTTTTCEAMAMGVPVVTLEGTRHAARVGSSLLQSVGLEDLVARSPEAFARTAASVAADEERRTALRSALRGMLRGSALGDAGRFARRFESAVEAMWEGYVESR